MFTVKDLKIETLYREHQVSQVLITNKLFQKFINEGYQAERLAM